MLKNKLPTNKRQGAIEFQKILQDNIFLYMYCKSSATLLGMLWNVLRLPNLEPPSERGWKIRQDSILAVAKLNNLTDISSTKTVKLKWDLDKEEALMTPQFKQELSSMNMIMELKTQYISDDRARLT